MAGIVVGAPVAMGGPGGAIGAGCVGCAVGDTPCCVGCELGGGECVEEEEEGEGWVQS